MWYVYILECKNNTLYTGIAKNPEERFKEHLNKSARFTSYNPPIRIVFQERRASRSSALKREAAIKKLTRKNKMELIKNKTVSVLIAIVALFCAGLNSKYVLAQDNFISDNTGFDSQIVTRVIDGDSLVLSGSGHARLIGVDTPEHEDDIRNKKNARRLRLDIEKYSEFSSKAKNFVDSLINGEEVIVEYDEMNSEIAHRDRYNRTLVYVWVPIHLVDKSEHTTNYESLTEIGDKAVSDTRVNLNALLIAEGFGFAYTRFNFKYKDAFGKLQEEARENKRGMWQGELPARKKEGINL